MERTYLQMRIAGRCGSLQVHRRRRLPLHLRSEVRPRQTDRIAASWICLITPSMPLRPEANITSP